MPNHTQMKAIHDTLFAASSNLVANGQTVSPCLLAIGVDSDGQPIRVVPLSQEDLDALRASVDAADIVRWTIREMLSSVSPVRADFARQTGMTPHILVHVWVSAGQAQATDPDVDRRCTRGHEGHQCVDHQQIVIIALHSAFGTMSGAHPVRRSPSPRLDYGGFPIGNADARLLEPGLADGPQAALN